MNITIGAHATRGAVSAILEVRDWSGKLLKTAVSDNKPGDTDRRPGVITTSVPNGADSLIRVQYKNGTIGWLWRRKDNQIRDIQMANFDVSARSPLAKLPPGGYVTISPTGGSPKVVKDRTGAVATNDFSAKASFIQVPIERGTGGQITIHDRRGNIVQRIYYEDYGVAGKHYYAAKPRPIQPVRPPIAPPLAGTAELVLQRAFSFVKFTINGKKYAVSDGNNAAHNKALTEQGYRVVTDYGRGSGAVKIKVPLGAVVTGTVYGSEATEAARYDFTVSNVGVRAFSKVTNAQIRTSRTGTTDYANPPVATSTDSARKLTYLMPLANTPGQVIDTLAGKINTFKGSVASATAILSDRSSNFSDSNNGLDELFKRIDNKVEKLQPILVDLRRQMDEISSYYSKHAGYALTQGQAAHWAKVIKDTVGSLNSSQPTSLLGAFQKSLDDLSGSYIRNLKGYGQFLEREKTNKILNIVNCVMGVAFMALGTANGIMAYLPGVADDLATGKVGPVGAAVAYSAVYSQGLNAPGAITSARKADEAFIRKLQANGPLPDAPTAFAALRGVGGPLAESFVKALTQFQVDVITNGPGDDNSPSVPGNTQFSLNAAAKKFADELAEVNGGRSGLETGHYLYVSPILDGAGGKAALIEATRHKVINPDSRFQLTAEGQRVPRGATGTIRSIDVGTIEGGTELAKHLRREGYIGVYTATVKGDYDGILFTPPTERLKVYGIRPFLW